MKFEVIVLDKAVKGFDSSVKKMARRLAAALALQAKSLPKNGSMEVYLINGKRMRALNNRFRGKNKSTNVLSFQKPKNFPGIKLGEVYLDPFYIKKHKEDLALMLVHGVLHILGYDHMKKNDRITMERKERQLLAEISSR